MYSQIYIESISKFQSNLEFFNKKNDKITFFQTDIYNILIKNDKDEEILSSLKEIFHDDLNNNQYFFFQKEKKDLKSCYENLNSFEHNFWRNFEYCVDVYLMEGQTDNVAHTIMSMIKEICKRKLNIEFNEEDYKVSYIRRIYFNINELNDNEEVLLDDELKLHFSINSIIHNIILRNLKNQTIIHQDKLIHENKNKRRILNEEYNLQKMTEAEFFQLNEKLQLGLTYDDIKIIREFYIARRDGIITRIELETFGQSWSEHCKHRIFAAKLDEIEDGLYKHYIKRATKEIQAKHIEKYGKDLCYSVFTDNAGAIEFNDNYLVTHKVETHNSPSALDPFGGAITGVLGVNRDCLGFGLGAKPIMNTFGFCFAKPNVEVNFSRQPNMQSPQLSSNYIIDGVIKGVEAGGNHSGIPTTHGVVTFNDSYLAKPLIFVGTVGLIPKKINGKQSWIKKPENGDLIVILGGRTGKDGIHGAIFSSDSLDENSNITHVQIGDPITQKKMLDAILEARDLGLYNAITDNGAGGFSSSIGEMGANGFKVDLRKALLKAKEMEPYEIWVSESQERMTLAVPSQNIDKLIEIVNKHDVEYQVLGEFNDSGEGEIIFSDDSSEEKSIKINMEFLHEGNPQYVLKSEKPEFRELSNDEIEDILNNGESARFLKSTDQIGVLNKEYQFENISNENKKDLKDQIISMMARHNLSSREELFTKFDHTVQGGSILQPINDDICADAGVTKPILNDCSSGVAISSYMNPNYGGDSEDTYNMIACSIDTAIRNLIVVGVSPKKIALLDNFCWSSSLEGKRLWQLKQACKACYDVATQFETPFISGKDSMFNDFKGFDKENNSIKLSALPTVLISSIGIVEDTTLCVTSDFKNKGDLIYVIGDTKSELGGSEYFDMIGYNGGFVPNVDIEKSIQVYRIFHELLQNYVVESAISIHNGGLINGLNRSGMNSGAAINFDNLNHSCRNIEQILFSESCGRILFSIKPENEKIINDFFEKSNFYSWSMIGKVSDDKVFSINYNNQTTVYSADDIKNSYQINYFKV
jgi:phosphoribosylformylglycinamidine (FGAM) synthase-like enzyme